MEIDKDHIQTQDETGELAPIDQVEGRVEAEMERLRGKPRSRSRMACRTINWLARASDWYKKASAN